MSRLRMMRNVSCALVITDGARILLVNPTNHDFWEPPKGVFDFGEDEDFTAASFRECLEETGLDFSQSEEPHEFVGVFDYNKKKDLAVTIQHVSLGYFNMFDISEFHCTSMFNLNGVPTPEIQGYKIVTWEDAFELVLPHMAEILKDIYSFYYGVEC